MGGIEAKESILNSNRQCSTKGESPHWLKSFADRTPAGWHPRKSQ